MDLLSDAMAEESLGLTLTAEIAYSSSIGQSWGMTGMKGKSVHIPRNPMI
jgi:hypothetical protein